MKYSKITIKTNTATSELVAYFLQKNSVDGVCIYDKNDLNNPTWDYVDENAFENFEEEVVVSGFVSQENLEDALILLQQDLSCLTDAGSLALSVETVDDASWKDEWKKYFKPASFGKIVVCPEWESYQAKDDEKVLLLDSGIAFGTGRHETTALCMKFMQQVDLLGKSCCDVGCGSGILGLTALLLGANDCTLVDVDEQAVSVCNHNAKINNLENKCNVVLGDLCDKVNSQFDVVFANLTADILLILAKQIHQIAKKGTTLILSGILEERLQEVKVAFEGIGFGRVDFEQMGCWCALRYQL